MILVLVLAAALHVSPKTDTAIFCDTRDEITAVVEMDDWQDAMRTINKHNPTACGEIDEAVYFQGKRVVTIRTVKGLYDIRPVFLVGANDTPIPKPMVQWGAFESKLTEVKQ
jgi:hypothetical protein